MDRPMFRKASLLYSSRSMEIRPASSHKPSAGFTGPISSLSATTVAYPGSVRDANADLAHSRYGHRKPQSYMYAPFYPPLRYDSSQQDFYGGNFWELCATGWKVQSPAAELAEDPPLDPNEHGLIDSACVVYRLSQGPYRKLFEAVWGRQAFAIRWPAEIEKVSRDGYQQPESTSGYP